MAASQVGGLGQPLHWSDKEKKIWIPFLFLGSVLIYAGRGSLSVSIVEMATLFNWDKRICVSRGDFVGLSRDLSFCLSSF